MRYRDDDERRALTPDDPVGAVVDRLLYPARFRVWISEDGTEARWPDYAHRERGLAVEAALLYRFGRIDDALLYARGAAEINAIWAPLVKALERKYAERESAARHRGTIPKRRGQPGY